MRIPAADARRVVDRLSAAGCIASEEEAEELVSAAADAATLAAWVRRREAGEPLAWITGAVEFCGRRVRVASGVYVPRRQTEELARRAVGVLPAGGRALDLCTGAGAVAAHLAAEVPSAGVAGVDVDPRAAACAARNGVAAVVGDVDGPLRAVPGVDVITAVAPYVPTGDLEFLPADVRRHEPLRALDGGDDGLDVVRRIVAAAGLLLVPGGWLLLEVGGAQDVALAPALADAGLGEPDPWYDDEGDLRGLATRSTGWR